MKKLIYSMLALALTAMTATTLVSCEDVPAPYDIPSNGGGDNPSTPSAEATGDGTVDNPYNSVAANKAAAALASGAKSDADVYIKGKVVSIKEEYSTQFGNATYYISDDGTDTNQFYVYRALYLGNKRFTSSDTQIQVGDEVVICGKLTNYNGTYETVQGEAYLYSLNGKTAGGDEPETPGEDQATGDGTLANPYNYVAANNVANALADNGTTENDVYIKGKVSKIKEAYGAQYGNGSFYISDDGSENDAQFLVYRALYLGNQKYVDGNTQIQVGDEVVVCGKITKYVGSYGATLETVAGKAYLYSLNGKTSDEGGSSEPSTPTTSGLISNGDFETWEGSTPTGWKSACSASSATLSQSTDAHGGSYSVSVGFNASGNKRMAYKEITLKPGTYTFSFYAKSTTSDPSQCRPGYVPVTDGSVGSYAYATNYASLNNSSWTLVSHEFTLTETTTICLVVMNPKTSSYATAQAILVDDASLTTTDGGVAE